MTRATVALAKGLHLHNGPETAIDDAITMRGELAAVRAQLDAANRRNQVLAADLARVTQENAAMASALSKANHTADELRYQLRIANRGQYIKHSTVTLTDRSPDGNGNFAYNVTGTL